MRLSIILFIVFITNTTVAQPLNNTKIAGYRGIWFELKQVSAYGDKYSGGLGTYTADHIPLAIYAKEVDKTFFVYGGTTNEAERHLLCMIGSYDHRRHRVEKPTVVCDKQGVDDPHDNPALLIDKEGYLWVFVSGRSQYRHGVKYRSVKPYSIDAFEEIASEDMTYPQPWQLDGGMMHLFTKYTGVRELYFETSTDGYTWTEDRKLAGIREPGHKQGGHYQVSAPNGNTVGTFFNRHPDGNVDRRTDLYYVQTSDMGQTWTNVAGTALNIPLEEVDNPAKVMDYATKKKNVYICDMAFDEQGYPMCLYITSGGYQPGPDNAPYLWHLIRWTGQAWETSIVGQSDHNYDMGSLYLLEDKWLVAAPLIDGPQAWGTGGEVAFYESTDKGKTWQRSLQITANSERNHSYVRRPLHVRDPFFMFWADGNAHQFSVSHLYFGDSKGNVWELPYSQKRKWAKPKRIRKQP